MYILPPTTTGSKINHTTFLVIQIPSHWVAYSYSPSPSLSPQENTSEFLININMKNQEVELHNALSSLTVLELRIQNESKKWTSAFFSHAESEKMMDKVCGEKYHVFCICCLSASPAVWYILF